MARILLVDDDDGVRTVAERILSAAMYEVDAAANVRRRWRSWSAILQPAAARWLGYASSRGGPPASTPAIILTAYPHRFRRADIAALRSPMGVGAAAGAVGGRLQSTGTVAAHFKEARLISSAITAAITHSRTVIRARQIRCRWGVRPDIPAQR